MDRKAMVDQWRELDRQMSELARQKDALTAELVKDNPAGTELQGNTGRVRVRDRAVLVPAKLEAKLSPALWRRITRRVPVAALYKAELERGKLSQDVMDAASTRSKAWLESI